MISFPVSRPPVSKPSPTDDASDDESPVAGKKHICPTCLKRFNRPSSLRIHVNTHTGATRTGSPQNKKSFIFLLISLLFFPAFRCPWPNCGREFNVNSNMRRHYRNHTTPGFSRAQPADSRRKRRRVDNTLNPSSFPTVNHHHHHQADLMPPISHFSPSDDDSDDESDRDIVSTIGKRDELVDYHTKAPAYNLTQSMARVTVTKPQQQLEFPPYGATSRYRQPSSSYPYGDTRSLHSSSPSNSSTSSPSPHLQHAATTPVDGRHPYTKRDHKYNPSAPYMHSVADTRVSTALRPAYHS
jgi:hypothetical protein